MSSTLNLSVADLAQHCAEETDKFLRRLANDPQYCFELMRRALAEQSDEAFTYIYQVYERPVTSWVYHHSRFALTGESAEFFTSAAFRAFHTALRGPKFDRFPTLAAVLGYLKMCVHSSIAQYLRDEERAQTTPLDDADEPAQTPDLGEGAEAGELWAYICRLLPDERDRLLARCAFAQGLKPREIVAAYRTQWSSEREVSVALYRIRRILRADSQLAELAGRD
jgi:hypothetical protein